MEGARAHRFHELVRPPCVRRKCQLKRMTCRARWSALSGLFSEPETCLVCIYDAGNPNEREVKDGIDYGRLTTPTRPENALANLSQEIRNSCEKHGYPDGAPNKLPWPAPGKACERDEHAERAEDKESDSVRFFSDREHHCAEEGRYRAQEDACAKAQAPIDGLVRCPVHKSPNAGVQPPGSLAGRDRSAGTPRWAPMFSPKTCGLHDIREVCCLFLECPGVVALVEVAHNIDPFCDCPRRRYAGRFRIAFDHDDHVYDEGGP
jgi:hypothetical protein